MLAGAAFLDRGHRRVGIFMARTGAVTQLGYRIGRVAEFLVLTRLIVVRVASRAIRSIARVLVGNRLRVGLVAIDAIKRLRVRARITSAGVLVIEHRRPGSRAMASNALDRCHKVIAWLAGRFGTVVASTAIAGYASVVECCGQPGDSLVAIAAIGSCRNMRRRFAGRFGAIVAAGAGAECLAVIHAHRRPC